MSRYLTNQPLQHLKDGWYIGLMSGTSLDGVDGVLLRFVGPPNTENAPKTIEKSRFAAADFERVETAAHLHLPFDVALVERFRSLNFSGYGELHSASLAANALAQIYSELTLQLCQAANIQADDVVAIGAHGQTVRHEPIAASPLERYTIQINNPAWLAEHTGIDVVADFRRRDMAAGGQGAPLASGFHKAAFGRAGQGVAVLNLGGIANFSLLDTAGTTLGFDVGPANTLMDAWCLQHTGQSFDQSGKWAAGGRVIPELLSRLLQESYFSLPAPKSTGVDFFSMEWLKAHLDAYAEQSQSGPLNVQDVQATLTELTALSCAQAFARYTTGQNAIGVCGGGAFNTYLLERIQQHVGPQVLVQSTQAWGIAPDQVEACAFAWLARQCLLGLPGNLPQVTEAKGARVLGAIYPAGL